MLNFQGNEHITKPKYKTGEKIKLEFSIINPEYENYSIQVKLYDDQVIDFNSKTKKIEENELIFEKFLLCDYYFEREQKLSIYLTKNGIQKEFNTTIGNIIGLFRGNYYEKISETEFLKIKAKKLGTNDDVLKINFLMIKKTLDKNFFVFNKYFYTITNNNKKLYTSEVIHTNGTFLPVQIPISLLQPFYTINFYNMQKKLISFNKTIKGIKYDANEIKEEMHIDNKLSFIDNSTVTKNYTLIDYINAGVKIDLSIGIDFSGSNGYFYDGALHSINNGPNDYEKAIMSCGYTLAYYDYDQLFPVFGFGAKIKDSLNGEVSNCFNLNFKNDPNIYTIGNIIKTYHKIIEQDKLDFTGPTNFAPLIKKVISRINQNNLFEYHILMILTDGVIDDLQDTIDLLVEASYLPLSVIIIGIGNKDFSNMEKLDGDENPIMARSGKFRARDIVQFVPFSKFVNDPKKLSMEVLAEIPRQMIEYYQFKNLDPDSLRNLKQQNRKIIKINPPQVRVYKVYLDNIKINVINQNNNQNKNIDNMTHRHYQNNQNHENNLVNPSFDPSAYTIDLNALTEFNTIYMPNQ